MIDLIAAGFSINLFSLSTTVEMVADYIAKDSKIIDKLILLNDIKVEFIDVMDVELINALSQIAYEKMPHMIENVVKLQKA
jgi:hypothetical protein